MNFIDIVIRADQSILHKEIAQVPDNFVTELLETYRVYYPDAVGDTQLFGKITRGLIEGIMANIHAVRVPPPVAVPQSIPMQFELESEREPAPVPPAALEETANV